MNVQGVPHFQFWKNGAKVDEFSGADRNQLQYLTKLHSMDVEAHTATFTTFPITSFALSELTTPIQGPLKKIAEFNDGAALTETTELKLTPEEISALEPFLDRLFAKDHTYQPNDHHYSLLTKFAKWPAQIRVPALDIIRSAFAHPAVCEHFLAPFVSRSASGDVISDQLRILNSEEVTSIEMRMLYRFVTNIIASNHLREAVLNNETVQSILTTIQADKFKDTPLRLPIADALLNLTIALESAPRNDDINILLTKALEISIRLMTLETDENALCRLFVGLGTVVVRNPPFQMILCGNANLKAFLELKKKTCQVEHNVKAISELLVLLSKPL